jgi:hypothetical protein
MSTGSSGLSQSIRHCSWREPREGGTRREEKGSGLLLPIHSPWQRRKSWKWNQNTKQAKGANPHLTGSMGIENKREERNHTLPTNTPWNNRQLEEQTRSHELHQLISFRDLGASESAQGHSYSSRRCGCHRGN